MFTKLGISLDLVPLALTALDRHSQNNAFYDPNNAANITQRYLDQSDKIFSWVGLPVNTKMSLDDFVEKMSLK